MKALDDIAKEATKQYWETGSLLPYIIRSAIDKALEVVLTREPGEATKAVGREILQRGVFETLMGHRQHGDGKEPWMEVYRAMQAALLAELRHSSVSQSECRAHEAADRIRIAPDDI